MSPERWQQIERLLDVVLDLPDSERHAYVEAACAGDAELRCEVLSLLDAHVRAEGFLDGLAVPFAAELIEGILPEEVPAPGMQVGAYRLLRELGRGGMGIVFLAERADAQFEQQVALKLVRQGFAMEEARRRFLAERQILARLAHPGIARLFDGGVTAGGHPFFVMEYVDGEPLDAYCDRRRLGLRERLRLFRRVCDAVHFAHQHLIVHRDLKPSNVLVTAGGDVKLLDFGIAKLLQPEPGAEALTRTDVRPMTPEYASPEQVRGEPLSTGSDVYGLGVLLYELLTGRRPYRVQGSSTYEVERAVLEEEPEKPSTAVSRLAPAGSGGAAAGAPGTGEAVSRLRGTDLHGLRRQLRGELDAIVLRALRKEPSERYSSAQALAEDLDRYLHGLPVLAARDTLRYRAAKFVRRHRVGVATTAAFAVLLVAFVAVVLRYAAHTAAQAEEIRLERDRAEQVSAFLTDLFVAADPAEAKGDTITARELLERGARKVERELADQPEVQARMMALIGGVYLSLGRFDAARDLLEEALRKQTDLVGPSHPDVAKVLGALGGAMLGAGRHQAADSLLRASLAMRRALLGPDHPEVAEMLDALGTLLNEADSLDAAEPLFREAAAINRRAFGPRSAEAASSLANVAFVLHQRGRYAEAESLYREVIDVYRATLGELHPKVPITMHNLAWLRQALDDLDEAEALFREALALRRRIYGDEHPAVANSISALADILRRKRAYAEAEPLAREALALRRRHLGPKDARVAKDMNVLARILHHRGASAAAESLYLAARGMLLELNGPDHFGLAPVVNNLALLYKDRKDFARAEPLYRQALTLYRKHHGDAHPFTAMVMDNLADNLHAGGKYEEALALWRRSLEILRTTELHDRFHIARTESRLGSCLTDLGRFEEAEPLLLQGYAGLVAVRGEDDDATRKARASVERLYRAWGRPERLAALHAATAPSR